ncbi:AH receptor-interacting protein [Armadillidium nasatum]|uniref:AH receptor-interacting protein n=1 Tax=Armadillidium nasatum TaxID=96803 RepID=A0A5N5SLL9_9CRUS|nr:AH receptor-interacting protein [Armadillidium nasatum]
MNDLIKKSILSPGKGDKKYPDGTKVSFHVKVETCEDEKEIDDSKKWNEPVELLLGKKFKLEVLEACVRTMMLGEVSKFVIDKKLLSSYPIVSKTLRDHHAKKQGKKVETQPRRCCGIELLKVEPPGSYEKEFWAMTEDEQRLSIPILREEGNKLYKQGDYVTASKKYSEAIGRLDNIMLKEKPHDEDWNKLNDEKLPLLLNYAQCQLLLGEYYAVIEMCTEVLKYDPENVKALFRRGKAYVKIHNVKEAKEDLEKVIENDPDLKNMVNKLLKELTNNEKEKLEEDKKTFQKLFS